MDAPNLALPVEQPPVLVIRDLRVEFPHHAGKAVVIDGIDLTVDRGKTVCIVGESGCGKSMLALSTMGLVPPPGRVAGTIMVDRTNIVGLPPTKMRRIRGRRIAMIFQEPMTSLNPVLSIGYQIMEALKEHDPGASAGTRKARAIEALVQVRMPAAERRFHEYPHQLSGGMRQRAMIAMALACRPDVLIADEPTTALDVTIQAQILELLRDLQRETEMAIILVTHDLGVVAEMALREVEEERCGERAVDDEAAIALFFGRIRQVIVDAVAVEGQRRVAEQQRLRRHKHPVRVPAPGIEAALARRRRGWWG